MDTPWGIRQRTAEMKRIGIRSGALLLLVLTAGQSAFAQSYVLTDLGTPGEIASYATGINSNGVVVGYSVHENGMTNRAWKWSSEGGRVDLGGFGGVEARALAVNNAGQIIGYATDDGGVARGFIYFGTNGLTDLGAPPVAGGVFPQCINSLGQVAGYINTTSNSIPFLWQGPGQWILPDLLAGADEPATAMAFAANDSGRVAGSASWLFSGSRAFVTGTNGGTPSALGTLGGETGTAYFINNAGQIVGEVESTNGAQRAFILDAGLVRDLGTLGGSDSAAFFINELGDIAGTADTASGVAHAVLWSASSGLEDLNAFIAPTLGWVLNEAHGINEGGLVTGVGTLGGQPRAFLLTPRDGPDTQAPVLLASLNTNFIGGVYFYPLFLTVTVWDDILVEANTLFTSSVRVTGPNGYSALATFTGRTPWTNAMKNVASYQINPPGNVWDGADNGTYAVSLEPNTVRDIAGNFMPAQALGTFAVAIQTTPTASVSGPTALLPGALSNFTFSAVSSYPSSMGDSFTFAIDWNGDGTVDETISGTSPRSVAHSFASASLNNIRVNATDPHGLTATASLEVFVNPLPGSWQSAPAPGTRTGGAGFFASGRLYYLGGDPLVPLDGGDSQVNYFTLGTAAWQSASVLDGDLYGMGAGVDSLGRIVIFGGHAMEGSTGSSGFIYTPGGGQGGGIATKNFSAGGFAWCADNLSRLYSIGGSGTPNVERYAASSNRWSILAPLPVARTGAAALYDGLGRIIVIGGADASVFAYNIAANSWSQLANAPHTHSGQSAALGSDGLVYVLSGASLMVFNPANNTWGIGPAPLAAHDSLVAGNDGWLYAFGGYAGTMEKLNPATAGAPPYFTTTANGGTLTGRVNQAWSYQASAGGTPPPGLFLASAPSGMTVTANGLLTWTPGSGQVGSNVVVLRATNSVGIAQQRFTVVVAPALLNNDTQAPTAPTNLVAATVTDTSMTLTWNPSTDNVGVAGYRFYTYQTRCSGFRCNRRYTVNVRLADNLVATTFTRTGLFPGWRYTFGVTAFDAAGNESPHTKLSVLTLSPPRIVPGYITAQSLGYAIVNEPWQQTFSASGNPPPTLSFVGGPPGMTFSNSTVTWNPVQEPSGTNSFTFRAVNTVTNIEQTYALRVYPAGTDLVPPSVVTGVTTGNIGADRVEVSWNTSTDNYGIAGYWVTATVSYRARYCARGCNRIRLVSRMFSPGTGTNLVLTGLEPNTHYGITVVAVDTAGNPGYAYCLYSVGGRCTSASGTTTPLLAVNLATLPGGDLQFSWTGIEPLYYRVGDYYAYTVVCSSTLATNIAPWSPLPGVTWPITNTSIVVPSGNATNSFYRVKADYIVH